MEKYASVWQQVFSFLPSILFPFPSCLISITFPFPSPGLFPFLFSLLISFAFFFPFKDPRPLLAKVSVCVSPLLLRSVKYEDPQALGSLASALDVRQQNAGGVSALAHRHTHTRTLHLHRRPLRSPLACGVCSAVCPTVTFVLRAAITKPWSNKKKKRAGGGVQLVCCQNKYAAIRRNVYG